MYLQLFRVGLFCFVIFLYSPFFSIVKIKFRIFLQETYGLKDVTFYDTGLYGTNNDKYYKTPTTTYEPLSDGTRLTGSSVSILMATESTSSWDKIRKFPVGTCMEFDIVEAQNMMLLIYYDNNGTDTNTIANTDFRIATEEETHWKVEVKADGIYKNGTKVVTANITKDISFGLQNPNANYQPDLPRMCKFKNFVIYPI